MSLKLQIVRAAGSGTISLKPFSSNELHYGATIGATIDASTNPAVNCTGADGVLMQVLTTSSLTFTAQVALDGSVSSPNYSTIEIQNYKTKIYTPEGVAVTPAADDFYWFHLGKPIPPSQRATQIYSFIPDATDELLISANARFLHGVYAFTIDATPVYVKLYDKATAPSEADTPIWRMGVPANSTSTLGSGNNRQPSAPIRLTNGLGVRAVTGLADASDAALTTAENYVDVVWS